MALELKNKKNIIILTVVAVASLTIGYIVYQTWFKETDESELTKDEARDIISASVLSPSLEKNVEPKKILDFFMNYLKDPKQNVLNCLTTDKVNESGEDVEKKGTAMAQTVKTAHDLMFKTPEDGLNTINLILKTDSIKTAMKKPESNVTSTTTGQAKKVITPEPVDYKRLANGLIFALFKENRSEADYNRLKTKAEKILLDYDEELKDYKDVTVSVKTTENKVIEMPLTLYTRIVLVTFSQYLPSEKTEAEGGIFGKLWGWMKSNA